MKQPWLEQRERSSVIAIRLLVWFALTLGRRAGRLLLYPVCLYYLLFSGRARRASRQYLARVLGRAAGLRDVFRHYYTFATVALDRMFFLKGRFAAFDVRVEGEDILQQALDAGEGCLLIGAHLGSFEALRTLGRDRAVRVGLVMYEDNARNVIAVSKAIDPELAQAVIPLGRFDSMLRLAQRLERGEWIGVLGDRALDREGQVRARFLGEPAGFPASPFRIAAMLKRPVVLMIGLYRGGNRYELYFERLIDPAEAAPSDRQAAVERWVERYAQRLEHYCRIAPYNWFNFYDFWDADQTVH
jgi:predicted LPLAT superfamily acyltransferase